MNPDQKRGVMFALLAAVFYALNAPMSKLLLGSIPPSMMAAFLYLGAGVGMFFLQPAVKRSGMALQEKKLTRRELPYTIAMVALDVAAPIALMLGIERTSAATVSLLNNFEIAATSLIALLLFREAISPKLWLGIGLVMLASLLLSLENVSSLSFSPGSLLVLAACICWGFENNCTRMLSSKSPFQIVIIKGIGSGLGALLIALAVGEPMPDFISILLAMGLGLIAYGLSITFYIYAQRELGAARTSAYYAVAPFIGAALSLVLFQEIPPVTFAAALVIMIAGTAVVSMSQ